MKINQQRMIQTLLELVQIDSHSKKEGKIASFLAGKLRGMGGEVVFDDAGEKVKGEVGNLIAIFRGDPLKPPIFLSAHMDTVVPGEGVRPVVEEKVIRSDGNTVLGGDDKSGVAIILEAVDQIRGNGVTHGDIEVVFTICEEAGLLGAKHLEMSRFRSRYGLVLDSDDAGFLFTRAPASSRLEFRIIGLEAHAGMAPEKGVSAIQLAGQAISQMKLGRIDHETTANLGVIQGGAAVNIVPNLVTIQGEARSHDEEKLEKQIQHMTGCFESVMEGSRKVVDGKTVQGKLEKNIYKDYERMDVSEKSPIVQLVLQAAENKGFSVQTRAMGGGCDANIFNRKGIQVANLGTGMRNIHSVSEYLIIDEFIRSAEIVYEVLALNSAPPPTPLYDRAVQIVKKLRDEGYKAYFAGGSVRDQIRGVAPTDYDIATSAKPEEVLSLFPMAIPVGVAFGVVLIPVGKLVPGGKKAQIEIATFRSDGVYRDGRHPESVIFSNEKEDALRRDFTINGMFFDPLEKRIIDYVGGREDLKAGLIRTIGEPDLRFKEDYLRIIRAVRFAAQFSFRIEPGTYEVIQKMAGSVRSVSQERIRDELEKIVTGAAPVRGLTLLEESGILKMILPEIIQGERAARYPHILKCLGLIEHPSFELAMAALLYQLGDAAVVDEICKRLKLSNSQTNRITSIIRGFPLFDGLFKMGEAGLKRFLRADYFKELLELYHAERLASGESLKGWEFCVQKLEACHPEDLSPPPLLSGNDLIKMGYSPGPFFKKILHDLEDLQLEGKIKTVDDAKALVLKEYKEYPEESPNKRKLKI